MVTRTAEGGEVGSHKTIRPTLLGNSGIASLIGHRIECGRELASDYSMMLRQSILSSDG